MNQLDPALLASIRRRSRCEWCGTPTPRGATPHHLWRKGTGGGQQLDHPWNLVALCMQCHEGAHLGHITRSDLLALVAAREGQFQNDVEAEIRRLRRMHR